jgi:hypothetical protein
MRGLAYLGFERLEKLTSGCKDGIRRVCGNDTKNDPDFARALCGNLDVIVGKFAELGYCLVVDIGNITAFEGYAFSLFVVFLYNFHVDALPRLTERVGCDLRGSNYMVVHKSPHWQRCVGKKFTEARAVALDGLFWYLSWLESTWRHHNGAGGAADA